MKIKRFVAPDIRKAMKMVKEELGADAVIMSNRSVDEGVEIVAARDFDEQAIHNDLQQQEQQPPQQVELDTFKDSDKPMHVISSSRKKGNETERRQNPVRKNMDQYLGYAEKIQLAGQRQQAKTEMTKTAPAKPRQTPSKASASSTQAKASLNTVNIEPLLKDMKQEMRNELAGLKNLLESRLEGLSQQSVPVQDADTRRQLAERLHGLGFAGALVQRLCNRLGTHRDIDRAFNKACDMLADELPMLSDDLLFEGGIAALVGPTGVGKTTTLAKMAAQFILQNSADHVALISMDNFRIGGQEQLKIYGRILGVPVKVANNADELKQHLDYFAAKKLVLIDTAGLGQRDVRLAEQINSLPFEQFKIRSYLVMSAATQGRSIAETINAFSDSQPHAAILTKLDEAVTPGQALSALGNHKLALAFTTNGQQVPEDFHEADVYALLQQCLAGIAEESDYTNQETSEAWAANAYV